MEIPIWMQILLWGAGAIATFAAAWKIIAPVLKLNGRVTKLEGKQAKLFENLDKMREESRIADRLLVSAMVEIVDNRLTNNNVEGLKSTKKDLMEFLKEN